MFFFFLLMGFAMCVLSFYTYGNKINPISIYFGIWSFCLLLITLNVISFDKLITKTWIVIIVYSMLFAISFFVGSLIKASNKLRSSQDHSDDEFLAAFDEPGLKKYLNRIIVLCTLISWVSVMPTILQLIRTYGLNLIANSNQIYEDSLTNLADANSGGFSPENFIFVALLLSGIYVRKFGISFPVILSLVTAVLSQLESGSRGGLFIQLALLMGPTVLLPRKNKEKGKSNFIFKILTVLAIVFLFVITYLRKSSLVNLPYASPRLRSFGNFSSLIYNITFYFTSPISTLNAFIQSPAHTFWGASTFRPFYLLLNALGITKYNVDFYNIYLFYSPLPGNVVSYIGELVLDFGFYGGGIATFIYGLFFGTAYKHCLSNTSSLSWLVVLDICFSLLVLSFFAWFLRPTYLWVSLMAGVVFSVIASLVLPRRN